MLEKGFNQYIRAIKLEKISKEISCTYPFDIPAIQNLNTIKFHPNVTYIAGENGTGKSTLLEAIAIAYGLNPEGGSKNINFATQDTHSILHKSIKLIKGVRRPRDAYFFRAESFYNLASSIDDYGSLIETYGGQSLHNQSHGEAFMSLILHRISGNGVYIFDEPEAALSPLRQMAFLRRIHDLVQNDAQLIIATHSPIIMSYPYATIYDVDKSYKEMAYEETDHYIMMKNFILKKDQMLDMIMDINRDEPLI